ncbi:MAG: hypothetical protein HGB12_11145 [Bacteroidetes bacterium]|nr:hypothetical protein [Bacteroidota bacterium]
MKKLSTFLFFLGIILFMACGASDKQVKEKQKQDSLTKDSMAKVEIANSIAKEQKAKADLELKKSLDPVIITFIESKTKNTPMATYRMYSYFVKNYFDDKETKNKMIKVASKLPYSKNGLTEVFFFNNQKKMPNMDKIYGWGDNESQNSWNEKYGKYCVGYYTMGVDDNGTFSKGWN